MSLPRIVILGGGFGGLQAAKKLRGAAAEVVVIDRRNHHLFQPLLYQVATAGLSPAEIASPIRQILRGRQYQVWMDEVVGIDSTGKTVKLVDRTIHYDFLVVATGATHSYFGHPEWEKSAAGLKTIEDATRIRAKILTAFEHAEIAEDEAERTSMLSFVIIGGGPTGVEMAGAIAELSHRVLARDFRKIDPREAKIILIEAGPRILAAYPEELSRKAQEALGRLGVTVKTSARVGKLDSTGVWTKDEFFPAKTILWAAGVQASPAGRWLGVETDPSGRIRVNPDLTLPGRPEIFVIGDTAVVLDEAGKPLPGIAPVAMQEGRYVARAIASRLSEGKLPGPFRYVDKGNLATVGRTFAVGIVKRLRFSGRFAWFVWSIVHIFYLIGFRNRIFVFLQWIWAYATFQRGARLITNERPPGRDG